MIYELLSDYTVVERTDWYALMVENSQMSLLSHVKNPLSNGMTLANAYFESVSDDGYIKRSISIPSGTYELQIEVEIQDTATNLSDYGIEELPQIQIWSGDAMYKAYPITDEMDSLLISSLYGMSNLRLVTVAAIPGTIQAKLLGIHKVADDYQVNLGQMQSFHGIYDGNADTLTTAGDIIYGLDILVE